MSVLQCLTQHAFISIGYCFLQIFANLIGGDEYVCIFIFIFIIVFFAINSLLPILFLDYESTESKNSVFLGVAFYEDIFVKF